MKRIMRALHIHWSRFHHREGVNVYTQCRCGKRDWHRTGQGYSPVNWEWLDNKEG